MDPVSGTDPAVNEALDAVGVKKEEFDEQAQKAEEDPLIQDKIKELSKDGKLTEEEEDQIGELVADKALEALVGDNKDSLTNEQKMALADYCGNCLDKQAEDAITESATA